VSIGNKEKKEIGWEDIVKGVRGKRREGNGEYEGLIKKRVRI
jgi:hypothetical protein